MGTVYELPVKSYPGITYPGGRDTSYEACQWAFNNLSQVAGDGIISFVGKACNYPGTKCAYYNVSEQRLYGVAYNPDYEHYIMTCSTININQSGYRGLFWGDTIHPKGEVYETSNALYNQQLPVVADLYSTREEAIRALGAYYPITYRATNATYDGPSEAVVGSEVSVRCSFPEGYGIVNSSDIYVTNNGVLIPSTYVNGTLTFIMPSS